MNIQEQMNQKQREYDELTRKIGTLQQGEVRRQLKQKRNALTGEIVILRQQLIAEQVGSDNPVDVPRVAFTS